MEACQGKGEESNRERGKNKRYWTYEEDTALIRYLHELSGDRKWKLENGFKNGYISKLEELIKSMSPNYGLKVTPHIDSRMKYLSEKYSAMAEMLSISGFGWDAEKKMLQVKKVVFDQWVKIYAKDKAIGDASESFVGAIEDMDQKIENHPFIIESESDDDVNSAHSASYSSTTQSAKKDNHPTPLKKEKVMDVKEAKEKGKNLKSWYMVDDDELVASLDDVSQNFGKIFENINKNLGTMASARSKGEEREQRMDEKVN
ncbi:Poly(A) RNA polymerase GLD2 [Bienertia sinuspersici]